MVARTLPHTNNILYIVDVVSGSTTTEMLLEERMFERSEECNNVYSYDVVTYFPKKKNELHPTNTTIH